MTENEKDNFTAARESNEVVLEYIAEPKPYVAYYVQDRLLPGKKTERAEAAGVSPRRRRHRGLKIFLLCLAAVLVLAGGLYAAWWYDLLPDCFYEEYYGNDYNDHDGYYYYNDLDEDAEPDLPLAPTTDEVRLTYCGAAGGKLTIQEVYRKVNPSTVTVAAELPRGGMSIGTGVIMTGDGYIITNAHVIAGSTVCHVILDSGARYTASLVGYDTEKDLAVIKAEATDGHAAQGLPAAEFGDSDALSVGDTVYAIGNPLGVELRGTLTDGIVSAINRDVDVEGVTMTLIQTNAALNNGNSGGPLINEYGQVVGINVMKMGMNRWSTASVEGLGFAIPISTSAYMINDLLRFGEVHGEPILGISVDVQPAYLPDGQQALRVYTIDLDGPGANAGLRVDDLIFEADGVRVETSGDLLRVRHRHAVGEEMTLRVFRDGETLDLAVTLGEKKGTP